MSSRIVPRMLKRNRGREDDQAMGKRKKLENENSQESISSAFKRKLRCEDYTVGWICAISTENVAAQAFLDEKHEGPEYVSPNDNNDYTLGKIEKHNVVIAVLPDGEYGISSAAGVARDMLHSFPNVRIGLMVSIGGGAPSPKHDIRLGDIVVSAPRDEKGGVFQYDFGKTIQDQRFQLTGFLNQPPIVLRTAVNGLKAQYEIEGHRLEEAINSILEEKSRLRKKYKRPDPSSDRLYQSRITHSSNDQANCAAVCGDDLSNLILRPERTEDEDNPAIHYGLIASANQLMKNALIRDKLAAEKDVLCFEMEAAGLMNHFPCLVIRGVCDYSDSHKNKEWQGYAAMAAAAYAKDLLCRIPPNRVEAEKRIGDILSGVQEGVNKLLRVEHDQEHEAILKWLTPIEYAPQQSDIISRRQEGTGQWLLDSDEFHAWISQSGETLFCPGIPGAGKTMMSAIVIDHLKARFENNADIGIAYIYCSYQPQQVQKPEDLLSSLLKQLIQNQLIISSDVKDFYKRHGPKGNRPSFDEIAKVLHVTVRLYSRVFIILDALDEYYVSNNDGYRMLLSEMFKLQDQVQANLLTTSRPIAEIISQFDRCVSKEIRAQDEDILRYINGRIPQLLRSKILEYPAVQDAIRSSIMRAAHGMFLLARLHMDSLMSQLTLGHIKQAMKNLPQGLKGLDETYDQAIKRIKGQEENYRELAEQVLSWVTFAKRALSITEIQHALSVHEGMTELDEDFLPDVEVLGSVCAGLISIDRNSDTIRLVHYTTQEYFERMGIIPNAQTNITMACVRYLSFDTFAVGICPTDQEFEARLRLNPLYDYASRNWGYHALASSLDAGQLILDFLLNEAKVSASSQAMMVYDYDRLHYEGYSQTVPKQMTGVHLAAYFGVEKTTKNLLENGENPNAKDGYSRTPLSYAAENGHEAVVRLLLAWADVDADLNDNQWGQTPLSYAAGNGHEAVVRLLLARADVDADSNDNQWDQTPLSYAAGNGHEAVVRLLLARADVDADSNDQWGRTPLSYAAEYKHEAVVRLLLARADVDADSKEDQWGRTPLSMAAGNGHEAVVRMLLARADVKADSKDQRGQTPLSWAATYKHEAVVRLLQSHNSRSS